MSELTLKTIQKRKESQRAKIYQLTYTDKKDQTYQAEMMSFNTITEAEDIGKADAHGVMIIAFSKGKLVLIREFRLPVNEWVYNLIAGTIEKGESIEDCVRREVFEETGLTVTRIVDVLPASYALPALADLKTVFVMVEAEGNLTDRHMEKDEWIKADVYTPAEVKELLRKGCFGSNGQLAAWFYSALTFFSEVITPNKEKEEIE